MRNRWPILVLLLLALLAQASVPLLHAQNWARMQGNSSLAYAVCGKLSPALAAKMRSVAPPELIRELAPTQNGQDCKLCFVVGALGAMLGTMSMVLWLFARKPTSSAHKRSVQAATHRAVAFQPRAPPAFSFA